MGHATAAAGNSIFMMEPIDYKQSDWLAFNPFSFNFNYYWVSQATPIISANYVNSVSTACNDQQNNSLHAWVYPTGGSFSIYYKISPYGYAFKPEQGVATAVETGNWEVYPNPATNEIVVANTTVGTGEANYLISDVVGRTIVSGAVNEPKQRIDISHFKAGNYFLQLMGKDGSVKSQLLVKE